MLSAVKGVYLEEKTAGPSHEHLSEWFYAKTHREGRGDIQWNEWKRLGTRRLPVYNLTPTSPQTGRTLSHQHCFATPG